MMEQLINEVTPTWQKETSLPETLSGPTSVAYNNKIYTFGGSRDKFSGRIDSAWVFDCDLGVWSKGKALPKAAANASAVLANDKAYVFGGDANRNAVQIYDFKQDTWSAGTSMPESKMLFGFAATVVEDKVYLFGGQLELSVYIYDINNDSWSSGIAMPSKGNTGRTGLQAVVVGSKIYVMGGYSSPNVLQRTVDIFDTVSKEWYDGEPLLYEVKYFGAVAIGSRIYIISGQSSSEYPLPTAAYYDTRTGRWLMLPILAKGVYESTVAIVGNKLYLIGGMFNGNENTANVYSLEIDTSSDLPAPQSLSVLLNTDEQVQLSVSQDLAENTELTWSSSVDSVATVDANGKVTALTEGLTYINAKNTDETFNESIPVKVFPGTADKTRLAVHLSVGQKQKLYLADDPSTVTWEAIDESIATVDAVGKVTAVSKGLAIVKGWIAGKEYQIYVRVSE